MPNTKMLSNTTAFRNAYNRVAWRREFTMNYFNNVNYQLDQVSDFDHRDTFSLIPLLIDMSEVIDKPQQEQEAYYEAQLRDIEQNFILTKNPETRLPYIRRMYELVATSCEIDWDNENEIEVLLRSLAAQQMLGKMVEVLPKDVLGIYSTTKEAKRLDNISIKNYHHMQNLQNQIARFDYTINQSLGLAPVDTESCCTQISDNIALAFADATDKGSNSVVIDPTKLDIMKKFFYGDTYNITYSKPDISDPDNQEEFSYDSDEASKDILHEIYAISGCTVNEHMTVNAVLGSSDDEKEKLLFINDTSVYDLIERKKTNDGMDDMQAKVAVGKMLRDALLDGKSLVTLMRPTIVEDGKISFTHQTINVDLDKLNEVKRYEKNNIFRRALDYIGIWKIKTHPSNKERDENQETLKLHPNCQKFFRNVEKKFVDAYNKRSKEIRDKEAQDMLEKKNVTKDKFINAYPEVSNVEDPQIFEDLDKSLNHDADREQIVGILNSLEEDTYFNFDDKVVIDTRDQPQKNEQVYQK